MTTIEKECLICKIIFKVRPSYAKIQKTCSYKCGNIYKKDFIAWKKNGPMSEDHKNAIRIANTGKKHSEESKIKISFSNKGKRLGCKLSEEHKEKLRLAHKNPEYRNTGEFLKGEKHKRYKGIAYIRPNHRPHKFVMERNLGRKINKGEVIHHIDGNPFNNVIENLMLFPSNSEHIKFHHKLEKSS